MQQNIGDLNLSILKLVGDYVSSELDSFLMSNEALNNIPKDLINRYVDCDYLFISSCDKSPCVEVLEHLSKDMFRYLISPKLSRLLRIGVIYRSNDGKEVDKFFESQVGVKWIEVPEELYVFEGELNISGCSECLGLLLVTDSGNRILLLDEACNPARKVKTSNIKRKRKRRTKRKKLKKKG